MRPRGRSVEVQALTLLPVSLYLAFESPVLMVVVGGITQAVMFPALAGGALVLRYRHLRPEVAPSALTAAALWMAAALITAMMVYRTLIDRRREGRRRRRERVGARAGFHQ